MIVNNVLKMCGWMLFVGMLLSMFYLDKFTFNIIFLITLVLMGTLAYLDLRVFAENGRKE